MKKNYRLSKANAYIEKLKRIARKSLKKGDVESALEAIEACANIYYVINQCYTDQELEAMLTEAVRRKSIEKYSKEEAASKTVLFYDGHGFDLRGLMLIYVTGLLALGYRVIYVAHEVAGQDQPELDRQTRGRDFVRESYSCVNISGRIEELCAIFKKYKPGHAFLYTTANDVPGNVVFQCFAGSLDRYFIVLADHAYWLGVNSADHYIEFRDYGATISKEYRGIAEKKIVKLPFYPYVNREKKFEGFPFEVNDRKVLFSGGGLYKTMDKEKTYYKIVDSILKKNEDVIYLYAGNGKATEELSEILDMYPGRAYFIAERSDLYQIMERIDLYLDTYPIGGGLMVQYAVMAGKLPIMLNEDNEGIFLRSEDMVYYQSKEELVADVDRLLADAEYRKEREEKQAGNVLDVSQFRNGLQTILESKESPYFMQSVKLELEKIRMLYESNIDLSMCQKIISRDEYSNVLKYFPIIFLKKCNRLVKNYIKR